MHNGMLQFAGEKMSKSLGNVVTLRDALDEWGPETLLMLFLGAHWRKPMDYTDETLAAAKARADGFREVFRNPSSAGGSWDDLVAGTRRRLQHARGARGHARVARPRPPPRAASRSSAWARSPSRRKRRPSSTSWRDGVPRPARAATSTRPTGCGDEIEAAGWEVRDVAGDSGYRLVPKR